MGLADVVEQEEKRQTVELLDISLLYQHTGETHAKGLCLHTEVKLSRGNWHGIGWRGRK